MLRILSAITTYKYVESLFIQYYLKMWNSLSEVLTEKFVKNLIHERVLVKSIDLLMHIDSSTASLLYIHLRFLPSTLYINIETMLNLFIFTLYKNLPILSIIELNLA